MSGYLRIFSALTLFVLIFITPSFAAEVSLPQTGQTTSYGPGDDGAIQAGIAWPSPRFNDNGDGTLTDNLTGLMWMKDADCIDTSGYVKPGNATPGLQSWQQAFDFVDKLNSGALTISGYSAPYTDWRVPNINEMESLVRADTPQYTWLNGAGFVNFLNHIYASSTTLAGYSGYAWCINMTCGWILNTAKTGACYVLPVRGISNGPAQVWQTGQSMSYVPGDDGADASKGYGATWDPQTRFIDNKDNTVTDTLTGLMWAKSVTGTTGSTWADALANVQSLNSSSYLGYADWRLPNRKEMRSLVDYSEASPPISAGNPFSVPTDPYWTSSRDAVHSDTATNTLDEWYVDTQTGVEKFEPSTVMSLVWPVRSAGGDTLTVNKAGNGMGQVTSSPSGINCGASCTTDQASFNANAAVVLTAAPSSGSVFEGWSGDATGSDSSITITMSSGKTVTATFVSSYALTVSASPAGAGSVTLSPQGPYTPGTQVTLTAVPVTGAQFIEWSGDATGSTPNLTVTMTKDMTITANFSTPPSMLSLDYTQSGTAVTLKSTLDVGGQPVPAQQVRFFETVSGKDVSCGRAPTGAAGNCQMKMTVRPGTHTWYAKFVPKGVNPSIMESAPVTCTIGKVALVSPNNNTVVNAPDPALSWQGWQGYDSATGYDVQVSNAAGFPAKSTSTYHETGTTTSAENLPVGKRYYWRVIADLPEGTSMPSATRSIVYKSPSNLTLALVKGSTATFKVILTDPAGNGIPGRLVKITGGKRAVIGRTLADGSVTKTIVLPVGSYSITATFGGDGSYAPSQSLPVAGTN
ncbi:MAG: DUF1566 domain-containing protein [Nitrospirota bacterium]